MPEYCHHHSVEIILFFLEIVGVISFLTVLVTGLFVFINDKDPGVIPSTIARTRGIKPIPN